jgi:hypothetical protein
MGGLMAWKSVLAMLCSLGNKAPRAEECVRDAAACVEARAEEFARESASAGNVVQAGADGCARFARRSARRRGPDLDGDSLELEADCGHRPGEDVYEASALPVADAKPTDSWLEDRAYECWDEWKVPLAELLHFSSFLVLGLSIVQVWLGKEWSKGYVYVRFEDGLHYVKPFMVVGSENSSGSPFKDDDVRKVS